MDVQMPWFFDDDEETVEKCIQYNTMKKEYHNKMDSFESKNNIIHELSNRASDYLEIFSNMINGIESDFDYYEDDLPEIVEYLNYQKNEMKSVQQKFYTHMNKLKLQKQNIQSDIENLRKFYEEQWQKWNKFCDEQFEKQLNHINRDNSIYFHIDSTTLTVELIDMYMGSPKPFLILSTWKTPLLIVLHNSIMPFNFYTNKLHQYSVDYEGDLTITQLKKEEYPYFRHINSQIRKVREKTDYKYIKGKTHPFDKPVLLRAQTSSERENYCWDGNQYGDTQSFFIVGFID